MTIEKNLLRIKSEIPDEVTLVAVTKTKSPELILEAYHGGHNIFGENKIQEMVGKWEALPKDIQWHMIGHVQRNKVKYMAPFVSLIHSVDSLKLLKEIDKQAQKNQRVINCLFQIHIAEESTKFGLSEDELNKLIEDDEFRLLRHVRIQGLMGMATFTENTTQIREEFRHLKGIFERLQHKMPDIHILSMGMSGDYQVAIDEGSTMVRIGSSIFGMRNYPG